MDFRDERPDPHAHRPDHGPHAPDDDAFEAAPHLADALKLLEDRAAQRASFTEELAAQSAPAPEASQAPPAVEIVVFPSRGFQTMLLDILADAAKEYDSCLLISATLPYKHLVRKAEAAGLRMDKFRVIDMVSAVEHNGFHDSGPVAYVSSPTLLEKVILLATEAVDNAGEGRHCLIVDSMSTLGFYNRDVALEQFTHRLTSLARTSDWGARFLMNDHPKNRELLEQVAHLFDGVSSVRPPEAPERPAAAPTGRSVPTPAAPAWYTH